MRNSRTVQPTSIRILLVLFLVFVVSSMERAHAAADLFPRYPSIEPNIEFWTSIYSRYTTRQGVIHDSEHLDRVFEIIELKPPDTTGSRHINRQRIRAAKEKYSNILRRLAEGESTGDKIFQRVASIFGPNATPAEYIGAARRIRCQVGQRDRFRAGLIRSGAYLETIREIFQAHDLPEALVFLPHVESSFNPMAYSKFGAAGIWQFTHSTGRRYMQVDYTVDERRDPILASHAAARLLKDNYQKLGSWPLAITAYNHGAAGMQRARNAHGDYETIFRKYRSRTFKFASRNFYSEFLAAWDVAANYTHYFGSLQFDPPLQRTQIRLDRYAPVAELARHLELQISTLRELNPALRDPVFEGLKYIPKGYRLQLPAGNRNWYTALAAVPPDVFREEQLPSRFHTVRRGDTAGKIARRYGVRLEDLIAANGLGRRATIYVNQNLRLPIAEVPSRPSSETQTMAAVSAPPEKPVPSQAVVPAEPPPPSRPPAATTTASQDNPGEVADHRSASQPETSPPETRVQTAAAVPPSSEENTPPSVGTEIADETLAAALQPESSPAEPAALETLSDSYADLPELPPAEALVTGRLAVIEVRPGKHGPVGIIQVEAEETLGHYAEWLDVRAWDVRRINGFPYGRMIHLGQKIQIPLHRVDRSWFEQQRYEYHKEMVEDFFSAYRVENLESYSVRKGDNIWMLSRERFELPIWLIRRYNHALDLHRLRPSDQLRIPVVEKIT